MFEKVNPAHPDKVADRIAGALVDLAYEKEADTRIAVEVLIGHGICHIIAETSVSLSRDEVEAVVNRIAGNLVADYREVPQDAHLSDNQKDGIRCGDNGIFKGVPVTREQKALSAIARSIYQKYGTDRQFVTEEESRESRSLLTRIQLFRHCLNKIRVVGLCSQEFLIRKCHFFIPGGLAFILGVKFLQSIKVILWCEQFLSFDAECLRNAERFLRYRLVQIEKLLQFFRWEEVPVIGVSTISSKFRVVCKKTFLYRSITAAINTTDALH